MLFSVAAVRGFSAVPSADVHPERAAQISAVQATPGVTWLAAAHPRFAAAAPGVSKPLLGVVGNWSAAIDKAVARGEMVRLLHDENVAIPESFDSATKWPHCAKIISDIRCREGPEPRAASSLCHILTAVAIACPPRRSVIRRPSHPLLVRRPSAGTSPTVAAAGHSLAPRRARTGCASRQAAS